MSDNISRGLDGLPSEGLALKLHVLGRLDSATRPLTMRQIMDGGPNRSFATVWYAMKALECIGVTVSVPPDTHNGEIRYLLPDGAREVVRAFLASRRQGESPPRLSPLPAKAQYQQVLQVLDKNPDTWFTVNTLTAKLSRVRRCARRPTVELYAHGYLLRRLPDGGQPGRAQYQYQINPEVAEHGGALLEGGSLRVG